MLQYQDALFEDGVAPGERDCDARWDIIKDFVPGEGMVLDVGSNLGYFGLRMVLANENVAVVSIEASDRIVERQRDIIASRGTPRICVIHGNVTSDVTTSWIETCDWFDLTLLLSLLHWLDDPGRVVSHLSQMSGRIIVEVPDPNDHGACGQEKLKQWTDPVEWFRQVTGRRCSLIGRVKRHTSEYPSHVILVEGPIARAPGLPYWDCRFVHPAGNDYRLEYNGERLALTIRDRVIDYVPGVNLLSLMKLGRLVWPKTRYWIDSGLQAMRAWETHRDPLVHNMLWTPHGLRLIDGEDLKGDARARAAEAMLKKYVRAWYRNKTAGEYAYVPHLPKWRRVPKHWALRTLRALLPAPAVAWLKQTALFKRWA